MTEINKEKMGSFISQLRKEKGMTQKELAEKLFISAKAVSKWETGISTPDVGLLMPLADILGVTVTELLQSEKLPQEKVIDKYNADEIVAKAIRISNSETKGSFAEKKHWVTLFAASLITGAVEVAGLIMLGFNKYYIADFVPFMVVSIFLGAYFTFVVKDRIPGFYDDNKINFYTDGFMKLNMPGLYFNNSNWPHIVAYIRYWSYSLNIAVPIFFFVFDRFIPIYLTGILCLVIVMTTLLVPIYAIGKKYE